MTKTQRFLGLISGTSADGIDTAIIELNASNITLSTTKTWPIQAPLRTEIIALSQPSGNELERCAQLDRLLGEAFATAALKTIALAGLDPKDICAIGSHGQTLRHFPPPSPPHSAEARTGTTLQIGDPNIIAHRTGITTVADFRRMDMAGGGQGAPLAPLFHQHCFTHPDRTRIILNIGGISNITLLEANKPVIGFDTGPGNGLMDAWCQMHLDKPYDDNGQWAAGGTPVTALVDACLRDGFFKTPPPKSTGREYFHLQWLKHLYPKLRTLPLADVQRSLLLVTAISVSDAIRHVAERAEVYLCGGGALNTLLRDTLAERLGGNYSLAPLSKLGIDGDFVEAATFAWLAERRMSETPVPLQSLTGTTDACILGAIYKHS